MPVRFERVQTPTRRNSEANYFLSSGVLEFFAAPSPLIDDLKFLMPSPKAFA